MKKTFLDLHLCKSRIVITVTLWQKYEIKKGIRIIVTNIGDAIILKPITDQYLGNL
jgi:hypothetical protein